MESENVVSVGQTGLGGEGERPSRNPWLKYISVVQSGAGVALLILAVGARE